MEKLLTALSSSEGIDSALKAGEERRLLTAKAKTLVGSCRSLPIHRTASTLAIDVVGQTMRLVGEELLRRDPSFRADQSRVDEPR
jgi:hypothetical protein